MSHIASYQEGYTDGYDRGVENQKKAILIMLTEFYNDNYIYEPKTSFFRGHNQALDKLIELVNDIKAIEG